MPLCGCTPETPSIGNPKGGRVRVAIRWVRREYVTPDSEVSKVMIRAGFVLAIRAFTTLFGSTSKVWLHEQNKTLMLSLPWGTDTLHPQGVLARLEAKRFSWNLVAARWFY
jgi:hypothetical protein